MKEKNVRGGEYITKIYTLLCSGADVVEENLNIAGVRCKQLTIGDKYRTLSRINSVDRNTLFEKVGGQWVKLPLSFTVVQFIYKLVKYRKYVVVKNKSDTEA